MDIRKATTLAARLSAFFFVAATAAEPATTTQPGTLNVIGVDEKTVTAEKDGVVVAFNVDHDTTINGAMTKRTRRLEARLERELKTGDHVNIRYERQKLANHAVAIERSTPAVAVAPPAPGEEARARAAERTTPEPRRMGLNVLGVEGRDLLVDWDGYVVRLRADHDTLIDGKKTAVGEHVDDRLKKGFKAGQLVNVEFERVKNENRAMSIAP
jgi:Cu/Ag efflux protein CusF